jgi:hypothetical protein
LQNSNGIASHNEGGPATIIEGSTCAGLGFEACLKVAAVEGMYGAYFSISNFWNRGEEHSTSTTISYSFEYTTSDDIEKAGNRSDMFLTPSLNVKFSKSAEISFDKAACSAASKEIVTWSLDSESNVPVCLHIHLSELRLTSSLFIPRQGILMAQC